MASLVSLTSLTFPFVLYFFIAPHGLFRIEALHIASRRNFVDMVQWMLQCGIPANARASNGSTALHEACAMGSMMCVQVCIFTTFYTHLSP